jgi:hypothetical protein
MGGGIKPTRSIGKRCEAEKLITASRTYGWGMTVADSGNTPEPDLKTSSGKFARHFTCGQEEISFQSMLFRI